jgi:hypothetical protein
MDEERMNKFVEEIKRQREKAKSVCEKMGHFFISGEHEMILSCQVCGVSFDEIFNPGRPK